MGSVDTYLKPRPELTDLNRPFWDYLRQHELRLQTCRSCRVPWYPIGPVCPRCLGTDYSWEPVSGRATLVSWVLFQRAYDPAFADDVPYNVALVQLDEGPLMFSNVVGLADDQIEVGMRVHTTFDDVALDFTVPRVRLSES
jgi:uncharacterized OB-fold protein